MGTSASYRGEVSWVSEASESGQVLRAVFRTPRELVLEIATGGRTYVVELRPTDPGGVARWRGSATRSDGAGATCDARLLRSDAELVLFGLWRENGQAWQWWAELAPEPAGG